VSEGAGCDSRWSRVDRGTQAAEIPVARLAMPIVSRLCYLRWGMASVLLP